MNSNDFNTAECEAGGWRTCDGEVGKLVHCLRWRKRSAHIRQTALLVTFVALTLSGSYFYSDVVTEIEVGMTGSPCTHYSEELRAFYCDKSRSELEPKLWEHISTCRDCRREFGFFSGISQARIARVTPNKRSVQLEAQPLRISFEQIAGGATLATSR